MLIKIDDCIHCLRDSSAVKAVLCPKPGERFESLKPPFFFSKKHFTHWFDVSSFFFVFYAQCVWVFFSNTGSGILNGQFAMNQNFTKSTAYRIVDERSCGITVNSDK